ncbi:MAG TPA: ABC transporter permease, partial [Pyrinomonadaceae bacterium]
MDKLLQDLRYGVRTLAKRPGFTAVAVLTLALGIGANTAIFSVVNTVLLNPLPYEGADRLVMLFEQTPAQERNFISRPNLQDYAEQSRTFEEFSAMVGQSVNLTGTEQPDRLIGNFVTSSFFRVLRARPLHGRLFEANEDAEGAERVAILSHPTWQTRFGGDPSIVGRALTLNGEPHTVVGILPEGFRSPGSDYDVYMPAQFWPNYKVARD